MIIIDFDRGLSRSYAIPCNGLTTCHLPLTPHGPMSRKTSSSSFPRESRKCLPPGALQDMCNRLFPLWGKDDLESFPALARVHFEIQDAEPLVVAEAEA